MKLWVYTDGTPEALPLYIETSAPRLAKKVGVTDKTVRRAAWQFKHGLTKSSRYEVVEVDE